MRPSAALALLGALLLALFVGYFAQSPVVVENAPVLSQTSSASSTGLSTLPAVSLPPVQLPPIGSTTPQIASTTSSSGTKSAKPKSVPAQSVSTTPAPAASTPVSPTPPSSPAPTGDLSAASNELRSALVNIICEAPAGSGLESISGSGVIIDSRGIILTNAHIGQYFLLANRGVSCLIRTGSPAQAAYTAAPIFVSPAWISANSAVLTESQPTGTGEHDITLLAITGSVTSTPLPASYPYVPLAEDAPSLDEQVVIGSYAAQFLQSSEIESDLSPTIVYGSIQDVFTFGFNTVDIVSLGGSAAAQEGSSGGGAIDANGELVATITTSTTEGDTSTRELNALTASYIRSDYASETGYTIDTLLSEKVSDMVANFSSQIPPLEAQITVDLH